MLSPEQNSLECMLRVVTCVLVEDILMEKVIAWLQGKRAS